MKSVYESAIAHELMSLITESHGLLWEYLLNVYFEDEMEWSYQSDVQVICGEIAHIEIIADSLNVELLISGENKEIIHEVAQAIEALSGTKGILIENEEEYFVLVGLRAEKQNNRIINGWVV